MEEFRRAHRRMFNSREDLTSEDDDITAMSSRTSPLVKSQPWSERSGGLTSSSLSSASPSSPARPSSSTFNSSSSSSSSSSTSSMSSSSLNLASARANLKPLSDSAAADKTSLKEFSVVDAPKATPRPPETYFEQQKPAKPNVLVSIGTYPTANQRPAPQKMEFLPKGAQNPQNARTDGAGSICHLQNELSQTLDRSNLRQRCVPLELPPEPPGANTTSTKVSTPAASPSSTSSSSTSSSSTSSSSTSSSSSSVTSATSLSSKYRGLGSEAAAVAAAAAAAASAVGGTGSSSSGSARPSVTINIKEQL